jgi:hypothetical protein
MTNQIRILQMFDLQMKGQNSFKAQNIFIGRDYTYQGVIYRFCPFEISGTTQALGGANPLLSVMLPNEEIILQMLAGGDGNRNSTLRLTQVWLTPALTPLPGGLEEFYVGIGAGDSDTTVELRFRSPMDAATSRFPRQILSAQNVGILPLSAELTLR